MSAAYTSAVSQLPVRQGPQVFGHTARLQCTAWMYGLYIGNARNNIIIRGRKTAVVAASRLPAQQGPNAFGRTAYTQCMISC